MKTGDVRQKQLSVLPVDFPRVNEDYTGRYMIQPEPNGLDQNGLSVSLYFIFFASPKKSTSLFTAVDSFSVSSLCIPEVIVHLL